MLFESSASLEESWLTIFRELGEPQAILACTYTFHADFFSELLVRFAEAACESDTSEGRPFIRLPVDVVCDRTRYKGHKIGFNVSFWPNFKRLFHPKLFIVLFEKEVVWSDGSMNLTPAGWHHNREIAMLHRPGRRATPRQLRALLELFPGIAAAERILKMTVNEANEQLPGQFLTSSQSAIGKRFLFEAPKFVDEVHLVAPFFEKDESDDVPLDDRWLREIVTRFRRAKLHVYLPQLEAEPLLVQGCREMFAAAEKQLTYRIAIHPVEPEPGPLHGKFACFVHTPKRIKRAYILVGSPNMTYAALLAPPIRGNIETAWILDERWKKVRRFLQSIGSKGRSIDDTEFVEPLITKVNAWMPLHRATFDPLQHTLKLEWRDPADAPRTVLRYAGRPISFNNETIVQPFHLVDGISWLVTHKRGRDTVDGCCPIDVPVELLPACNNVATERSPEDWLSMLGAVSAEGDYAGRRSDVSNRKTEQGSGAGFEWSKRVRDLAAKMRYVEETLCDENLNSIDKRWLLKLFQHIYNSHDPSAVNDNGHEQVWRAWVRLELWHVAKKLSNVAPSRSDRAGWRAQTKRLRRGLRMPKLPSEIRSQFRVTIEALREAT